MRIKKMSTYRIDKYDCGEYIMTAIDHTVDGTRLIDMYLTKKDAKNTRFCFGFPFEQPSAKDGHTKWTRAEIIELFRENLPNEMRWYEDDVAEQNK